jgi:hypothetical protein
MAAAKLGGSVLSHSAWAGENGFVSEPFAHHSFDEFDLWCVAHGGGSHGGKSLELAQSFHFHDTPGPRSATETTLCCCFVEGDSTRFAVIATSTIISIGELKILIKKES